MKEAFPQATVLAARQYLEAGQSTGAAPVKMLANAAAHYVLAEDAAAQAAVRSAVASWRAVGDDPRMYSDVFGALELRSAWNEACWVIDTVVPLCVSSSALIDPAANCEVLRAVVDAGHWPGLIENASRAAIALRQGSAWASGVEAAVAATADLLATWELDDVFVDYEEALEAEGAWVAGWRALQKRDVDEARRALQALSEQRIRGVNGFHAQSILGAEPAWMSACVESLWGPVLPLPPQLSEVLQFWASCALS